MLQNSWFLWKEVPAEGDLEDWLTRMVGEISADSCSDGLAELGNRIYASVKDALEKEHPGKTALIIPASQLAGRGSTHLVIVVPAYSYQNPGRLISEIPSQYGLFFAYTHFIGGLKEDPNAEKINF